MRRVHKLAPGKVTRLRAAHPRHHIELTAPRLFHDESRREIRVFEHTILGRMHAYDRLELCTVPDA